MGFGARPTSTVRGTVDRVTVNDRGTRTIWLQTDAGEERVFSLAPGAPGASFLRLGVGDRLEVGVMGTPRDGQMLAIADASLVKKLPPKWGAGGEWSGRTRMRVRHCHFEGRSATGRGNFYVLDHQVQAWCEAGTLLPTGDMDRVFFGRWTEDGLFVVERLQP